MRRQRNGVGDNFTLTGDAVVSPHLRREFNSGDDPFEQPIGGEGSDHIGRQQANPVGSFHRSPGR